MSLNHTRYVELLFWIFNKNTWNSSIFALYTSNQRLRKNPSQFWLQNKARPIEEIYFWEQSAYIFFKKMSNLRRVRLHVISTWSWWEYFKQIIVISYNLLIPMELYMRGSSFQIEAYLVRNYCFCQQLMIFHISETLQHLRI